MEGGNGETIAGFGGEKQGRGIGPIRVWDNDLLPGAIEGNSNFDVIKCRRVQYGLKPVNNTVSKCMTLMMSDLLCLDFGVREL